jgi:hypothetical protein
MMLRSNDEANQDEHVIQMDDMSELKTPQPDANEDVFLIQPYQPSPPRLNNAQIIFGNFKSFTGTVAIMVAGAAIARDEGVATVPVPGDYAVTMIALIGIKEAMASLYAFARREHPLHYMQAVGHGNFVHGLLKESAKKTIAMIPPVLIVGAASFGRDALYNFAMDHMEEYQNLLLALIYFDSPLLRTLMLAGPGLAIYWLDQKIMERCISAAYPVEVDVEVNPILRWYQDVLYNGLVAIESVALAELSLQVFNTIGPALVLHMEESLWIAPILALGVLKPWGYLTDTIRPFDKLGVLCGGPQIDLDEPNEAPATDCRQTNQIIGGVSLRIAVAAASVALVLLSSKLIIASTGNTQDEDRKDPAIWSTFSRLGAEVLLAVASLTVESLINHAPRAFHWVSGFSLFNRNRTVPATDEVLAPAFDPELQAEAQVESANFAATL